MVRALEVAEIFRVHGPAWRQAQSAHLSLGQLKVMSAIEQCRSAVLGGHVLRCEACEQVQIAYNSCRNRHCPKCQNLEQPRWVERQGRDLLPVRYFHVVFTVLCTVESPGVSRTGVARAAFVDASSLPHRHELHYVVSAMAAPSTCPQA